MKVILLNDVPGIGKKDTIVNVKDGYALNYLLPRKLAVMESEKSLEVLKTQQKAHEDEIARLTEEAKELAAKINQITLEFTAKGSGDGRMFGTISTKQIADELKSKHGIEIDKRKFIDKVQADHFGYTKLTIELYKGVTAVVNVHISEIK